MSSPFTPDRSPPRQQGERIASGFRVVSLLTFGSRILGMVRDMAMAYAFGAGPLMDAFTVAFRIPNLARRLFGEGALATAFLPVFVRELDQRGPDEARRVATALTVTLGTVLLAVVIAGELLLGIAWWLFEPGSEGRLLILLTAEMTPYLLLICVAAQLSAVLQSVEQFFWPALLPVLLNIVWIGTIVAVVNGMETPSMQIQAVALSVVAAGILQCGVAWWAMHRAGFHFVSQWRAAMPQVREIAATMMPILFGLSITQINSIADNLLAWALARPTGPTATSGLWAGLDWPLEPGTASALFFAQRLFNFPVGVFGVALGTVLFPVLARHAERGDLPQVGRDQTLGLTLAFSIGLPASLGLMLLSQPIAVLFFQRGAFTASDAALTAQCIVAYGSSVWATLGLIILHRGFYALGDRLTPIRVGLLAVGVNLVLDLVLIWPLAGSGLAWASALADMLQVAVTLAIFERRFGLLDRSLGFRSATQTLLPTAVMAAACWILMQQFPPADATLSRLLAVGVPLVGSVVVYLATAKLVGLREPFILLSRHLDE